MNYDSSGAPLWQYDTDVNTWTRKANFPAEPRLGAISFGVNGYGYVGLGTYKDFWQYDPVADSWTQKANYPGTSPTYAASFVIGNYAYIGAGMNGNNTPSGSTEFYQYDPSTDAWTQKTDFPGGGRNSPAGFAIDGNGYLGTGYDLNGHYLSDFWKYNPSTNTWSGIKDFGGGIRADASGFATAHQGYLGFGDGGTHQLSNGYYGSPYFDFWQYQP
jgi:N-acetylneuraminic acid mutarotase